MTASAPTVLRFDERIDWLRARRISGSDVATLLDIRIEGVPRYRSAWDILERLQGIVSDDAPTPEQQRGRDYESYVLRRYVAETGTPAVANPDFTLYVRDEWASATPDALSPIVATPDLVVELKTDAVRSRWGQPCVIPRWDPSIASTVRVDYYLQAHHTAVVVGVDAADLAVLLPSGRDPFQFELRVYRILRDPDLEERMNTRLSRWWRDHVVGGQPLPADGSMSASRILASHIGEDRIKADPSTQRGARLLQLAAAYETARQQFDAFDDARSQWEREKRRLGQELILAAGRGARRIDLPRGHITLVRSQGASKLDEDGLLADHPDLADVLDRYRSPGRPFTFPKLGGMK